MGLVTIGVDEVAFAPLAGDGGPGTEFTRIGFTSKGTLSFNEAEPTKKLVEIEESSDPLKVFKRAAPRVITLSLADPDLDDFAKIRGGTVSTVSDVEQYEEDTPESLVGTLRITPSEGLVFQYNKVSIDGRLTGGLGADQELLLVLNVDIEKPTKEGVKVLKLIRKPSA